MDQELLIVGAGPTGLTLAEEAARFGVRYRIVDSGRDVTDLSKAIGVQARTLELFDLIGIADELVERGNRIRVFNGYDGCRRILHLDFTGIDSRFPFLLTASQHETEQLLAQKIKQAGGSIERSTVLTRFSQDDDGVEAILRHGDGAEETVRARWLAGCDGAHSAVREGLGMPFLGKEYEEGFVLADVKVEGGLAPDEIYLFLHEGWLLGFFPMAEGRCRFIADLPPEEAPRDRTPTLEECQRAVDARSPFPLRLSDPNWTSFYRIHRRMAPTMRQGRVFLAGDAVSIHSPAAAQGMNTGIQDAFNLGWKLGLVAHDQAGEALLDSYSQERYPVEQAVSEQTDRLLQIGMLKHPIARKVRDFLLPIVSDLPGVREQATSRISELGIGYRGSSIVRDRDPAATLHACDRAPDVWFCRDGEKIRLYELMRDGRFLALIFAERVGNLDREFVRRAVDALEPLREFTHFCLVSPEEIDPGSLPSGVTALWDHCGYTAQRYGSEPPGVRLIRPDGYLGFQSGEAELAEGIRAYAGRLWDQTDG